MLASAILLLVGTLLLAYGTGEILSFHFNLKPVDLESVRLSSASITLGLFLWWVALCNSISQRRD